MKYTDYKDYIPSGSAKSSLAESSFWGHNLFSHGFFHDFSRIFLYGFLHGFPCDFLYDFSHGFFRTEEYPYKYPAGRNHLVMRSSAILTAVILTFTSVFMPLSVEAKEKTKDKNEIYSEAIYTADGLEDYNAERAYNQKQPVQTNQVANWPKGPTVGAAGAIVMDADSGTILYGKNIDKHLYPASITKVMTALLAYENLNPSDKITFSESAVFGIEIGSSNIGMDVGETITVDEALYGLMVASANEVAVALAERVSGSEEAFADLMNTRAKELGCQNTHFVTSNGLHRTDHYTCARDMALIAKEIYKYPDLVKYMSQMNYHFEKTDTQADDFWVLNTNDFLTGEVHCEDVIGGKTGYTDQARETLLTFAERDGVHLICVIMREEPPHEYYDTIDLLEYGFENFKSVNISKNEDRFLMKSPDFLSAGDDIFGRTTSSCMIPEDASLMIPKKSSFSDLTASLDKFTYDLPEAGLQETVRQEAQSGETATAAQKDSEESSTDSQANAKTETESKSASDTGTESKTESATDNGAKSTADSEAKSAANSGTESKTESAADNGTKSAADSGTDTGDKSSSGEDPSHILEDGTRILGVLHYSYNDYEIGSTNVLFREAQKNDSDFNDTVTEELKGIRSILFSLVHTGAHGSIYLNILLVLPMILAISFLLCVIFFFRELTEERKRRSRRQRQRQRRRPSSQEPQRYTQAQNRRHSNMYPDSPSDTYSNTRSNTRRDRRGNRLPRD